MKIALDAGHGINTAGKRVLKKLDSKETREWTLNNRIVELVREKLMDYECEMIILSDVSGKKDISLNKRVNIANEEEADLLISIHHNAGINGGLGGGTVVYYASSENERKNQARRLYNALVKHTKLIGNRSAPVAKRDFYIISNSQMPAFLIENGFMDSKNDVPIILSDEHAMKTAEGIVEFVVTEFKLSKVATYSVQVGSYTVKDNAIKTRDKLNQEGYNAYIVKK